MNLIFISQSNSNKEQQIKRLEKTNVFFRIIKKSQKKKINNNKFKNLFQIK